MGLIRWAVTLLLFTIAYTYIPRLFAPKLTPIVEGYFHPKFRKVAETIRQNVESGKERGGAFAVYHRGNLLIDMWCGYADAEARRPWSGDTMTVMFSSTKTVAAILIARMVDKGWLDYDKPVAHYWPEFAQNGKGEITVVQLLAHQAGLISLGKKIRLRDVRDNREQYIKTLEQAEPAWKPGTAHGYHAITFGMFVDVLAEKADPHHRNITQLFQEEIATPFGIEIYIGLPKSLSYRMARGHDMSNTERLLTSLTRWTSFRIFLNIMFYPDSNTAKAFYVLHTEDFSVNNPDLLNIGLSSFLGVGTASGLAKLYSYLSMDGTVDGRQLLSPDTSKRLLTPIMTSQDAVLGNITNSYGPGITFKPNPNDKYKGQYQIGHPGAGGQVGFVDPTNQLAVAYLTNYQEGLGMWDDPRYLDLDSALYECLKDYIRDQN